MTNRQREYWSLFAKGLGVSEIARTLGVSKSTVSMTLKAARQHRERPVPESVPCRYSPSCFTCPLADCVVAEAYVNVI